jgi:hypothetical protein
VPAGGLLLHEAEVPGRRPPPVLLLLLKPWLRLLVLLEALPLWQLLCCCSERTPPCRPSGSACISPGTTTPEAQLRSWQGG